MRERVRLPIVFAPVIVFSFGMAALWLWLRPPDLIRVGSNYTAKMICSNVFLAGRDPEDVLRTDVQAPGNPLLRVMRVEVDRGHGVVRAGLFGFIGGGLAVFRPDTGCTVIADGGIGDLARAGGAANAAAAVTVREVPARPDLSTQPDLPARATAAVDGAPWPDGDSVQTDASIMQVIANDVLAGPGMRAILVVHDGRLVAERYAGGFGPATPQLGWSMTKSVMAGLIGILVKDGTLDLARPVGPAMHWADGDARAKITLVELMAMSSGLEFNEGYGAVSDVTRMLYLTPDMAAFAGAQPLMHPIGTAWSYSSGTAVIVSRIFQDAAGGDAPGFVRHRLFEPLGMASAVMETDEHGTLVGSSYMYATPRDWARYGVLLAQAGVWRGREIMPPGYVAMMASPVAASRGQYGHGMVWRWTVPGIPSDAFYMSGHDGQTVAIVPSKQLVILRMGLTPERENYQPEVLVRAVLGALR